MTTDQRHEFLSTISSLFDGTLACDDPRAIHFAQQLAADAEVAALYLEFATLDVDLQWLCNVDESTATLPVPAAGVGGTETKSEIRNSKSEVPPSALPLPSSKSPVLGFLGFTSAALSKPVLWSILAAGIVFAGYVTMITWGIRDREAPTGTAGVDSFVATITDSSDAEWSGAAAAASTHGESVATGEPLEINSGLVELKLKHGATLLVEGPASWSIDGDNRATLTQGKVVAIVPPEAIGFTLDTPTSEIVDLGTEFGVEVTGQGAADVQVLKGRVEVRGAKGSGKPGPGTLEAGQSLQITAEGTTVKKTEPIPEKFKRLIEAGNKQLPGTEIPPHDAANRSAKITLQQGKSNALVAGAYSGCRDVQLISWGPDNNFGKRGNFDVGSLSGPANSILRFDLTPLAGKFAKITGARLILNQDQLVSVRAPGVVNLHQLAVANRDWVEGNGISAPPPSKDGATWNQRKPGARWAGAAGASKAGTDYDERVLAHHDYEATFFNKPFVFEIDGDLKFLADWANDDATNAGFLLHNGAEKTANNRITFYSSDFPDVAARPSLEIEYEPLTNQTNP